VTLVATLMLLACRSTRRSLAEMGALRLHRAALDKGIVSMREKKRAVTFRRRISRLPGKFLGRDIGPPAKCRLEVRPGPVRS
jgi:hypothetical protein